MDAQLTSLTELVITNKTRHRLWRPFETDETTPHFSLEQPTFKEGYEMNVPFHNFFSDNHRVVQPVVQRLSGAICNFRAPELVSPLAPSAGSAFRKVKRKHVNCPHCTLTFLNLGQLSGHVRAHTGDRPFSCEAPDCGRAFARNEELTRHKRIHSGDKPHNCEICGKSFGRKDHLNKHRKTHLKTCDKKVYHCPVPNCAHSYTRSDALARHQTNAHKITFRFRK